MGDCTYIDVDKTEWVGKQYVEYKRIKQYVNRCDCVRRHEPCVGVKVESEAESDCVYENAVANLSIATGNAMLIYNLSRTIKTIVNLHSMTCYTELRHHENGMFGYVNKNAQ